MDVYPKFIVESDVLILSMVTYHKQLVTDENSVRGGGWFKKTDNDYIFYGSSFDYGAASIVDIKKCIAEDKVFTNRHQTHSIAKKFKFAYQTETELIKL